MPKELVRQARKICWFAAALAAMLWLVFSSVSNGEEASAGSPRLLTDLEPHWRNAVLRGWRSFQTSFAQDGVACVHCHPNHAPMKRWAGAYPKVQLFDGTPYRVKSLRQVVMEAIEKHTDLAVDMEESLIEDLVAYLSWWGDGQTIMPGRSREVAPPSRDLLELADSVTKGRRVFDRGCSPCHGTGLETVSGRTSLAGSFADFPRYVEGEGRVLSLESYLANHLERSKHQMPPEYSRPVIHLMSYLARLATGSTYHPGGK